MNNHIKIQANTILCLSFISIGQVFGSVGSDDLHGILSKQEASAFQDGKEGLVISPISQRLSQLFSASVPYEKRRPVDKDIAEFYQRRNFQPVWFGESSNEGAIKTAIDVLRQSDREGLEPSVYEPLIRVTEGVSSSSDLEQQVRAEIDMTRALLQYIDDVGGERLSPKRVSKKLFINPDPTDAVSILYQGVQQDPTMAWLQQYTIERPEYQKLKTELYRLRQEQASGGWATVSKGPKLKIGMSGDRIKELRQSLMQQGYEVGDTQDPHFDEALETSVKQYQENHGMEPDGVVGTETIDVINIPIDQRIKHVVVSMERWRWFPKSMHNRYVIVNTAGYELRAYEDNHPALYMRVIVGQKMRQTPVFSSVIYSVRFNPSWGVPHMIAVQDKLKVIQKDPSYLVRKGFVVYDSNNERVSPDSVDWSSLSKDNFPYRLRQMPGTQNALGKIRFSITSPFDVYLHDTAEPKLFQKAVRDFSSGCIRVEKPLDLGVFVFNNSGEWPREKIQQDMQGNQTRNIDLKDPVPVHIAYFTVWVDEQGATHFVSDVYGQDKAIEEALGQQRNARIKSNADIA